jgi:hypothetical protein
VTGICVGTDEGEVGLGGLVSRSIRRFNFCWVLSSRVWSSEIACSREVILSISMSSGGVVSRVRFPKMAEEESSAGKYTERSESLLGLRKTPMVTKTGVGLVLEGDPFLMLGQLPLSRKLAGDPKSLYFYKYNDDIPSRGS